MTENNLLELYCTIDDFYQCFIKTEPGKKNLAEYYGKRGPKRSMTVPEVMTLNIVRILDRTGDLKTFHKTACLHYRSYFPNLTNYENFMKASNKAVGFIAAFIQVQLYLNQENCNENTFFLDSTPVTVCENRYISSHKVAKAIASRGKSPKGLKGTFVTDAGFLLKESELKEMFESERKPCTATRRSGKNFLQNYVSWKT